MTNFRIRHYENGTKTYDIVKSYQNVYEAIVRFATKTGAKIESDDNETNWILTGGKHVCFITKIEES